VFSVADPMDHAAARTMRAPQSTREPRSTGRPRWLFKVVDVVSDNTIVEDADASATVDTLTSVESIFDVWIFVWIPELAAWRQLTPGEHRMLWDFRGR
jgi:hypothetical protein